MMHIELETRYIIAVRVTRLVCEKISQSETQPILDQNEYKNLTVGIST
jgi:hypothetical protein